MRGALVLAGGKSTRFGRDKAVAELRGKPLLAHVTQTAARVAGEVVVAVGRESSVYAYKKLLPYTRIVKDRSRVKAPMVGIVAGFQVMQSEYAAVLSCDTPFVRDDVLRLLFRRAIHADAAIPKWPNGDIEPLQAVYKVRSAIPAAKLALRLHEFRNVDMIRRLGKVTYVPVREIRHIDRRLITLLNVNRPLDLRRAEALT